MSIYDDVYREALHDYYDDAPFDDDRADARREARDDRSFRPDPHLNPVLAEYDEKLRQVREEARKR